MKDRLSGISWGGYLDRGTGVIRSEAWYKMRRVKTILETLDEVKGDLDQAAGILNWDADEDDPALITTQEIRQIAEFALNNPIATVREL